MLELSFNDALKNSAQNSSSKWPRRHTENRLEPECWPTLKPGFQLQSDSRVFTIGSCFARNIEVHLARMGLQIPTYKFFTENANDLGDMGTEVLNKYTSPAIYQELLWTKGIFRRDDIVKMEDIEQFLFSTKDGKYIDLQRRYQTKSGVTKEQALDYRRKIYQLTKQAFECNVIIITLGYVECWFDRKVGQYIEFDPRLKDSGDASRFVFRVLGFNEAYAYTSKTIDILRLFGDKKILITTSPVPIARTFTEDDVIIANTYSKSVQRAVAGEISQNYRDVDYFPSYENVILTRQNYVWIDDLIHVEPSFIGRIMLRVVDSYVVNRANPSGSELEDDFLLIINLVKTKRFDEARSVYLRIGAEVLESLDGEFHVRAAELCLQLGDRASAKVHVDRARDLAQKPGEIGWYVFYQCKQIYEMLGARAEAEWTWQKFLDGCKKRPMLCEALLRDLVQYGINDNVISIMQFCEKEISHDINLLLWIANIYEMENRLDDAERIYRSKLNDVDAVRQLSRIYVKQGRYKDAEKMCLRWLDFEPSSVLAHLRLAQLLSSMGRFNEAEQVAKEAKTLDPNDPKVAALLHNLSTAKGRVANSGLGHRKG